MLTLVFVNLYTNKHNHLSIHTDPEGFLKKLHAYIWVLMHLLVCWGIMRFCFCLFLLRCSLCGDLEHLAWFNKTMFVLKLKMRAGGISESSKWKKQKRSPRPPHHMVRSPSGQMDPAQSSTLTNNLSGIPKDFIC